MKCFAVGHAVRLVPHSPTSFSYQWQDCDAAGGTCANIGGATSQTYALAAGDSGHTIRVQEFATNVAGTGGPATSTATALVPSESSGEPVSPAATPP